MTRLTSTTRSSTNYVHDARVRTVFEQLECFYVFGQHIFWSAALQLSKQIVPLLLMWCFGCGKRRHPDLFSQTQVESIQLSLQSRVCVYVGAKRTRRVLCVMTVFQLSQSLIRKWLIAYHSWKRTAGPVITNVCVTNRFDNDTYAVAQLSFRFASAELRFLYGRCAAATASHGHERLLWHL